MLALRFSTRAESARGVETFEGSNLVELVSGDDEIRVHEFDEAEEPEFERPKQVSERLRENVRSADLSP